MQQCQKVLWIMVVWCVLIEAARCFSVIEENSTHMCTHASLFLMKHREPKSSNDKLSLSMLVGIVEYA